MSNILHHIPIITAEDINQASAASEELFIGSVLRNIKDHEPFEYEHMLIIKHNGWYNHFDIMGKVKSLGIIGFKLFVNRSWLNPNYDVLLFNTEEDSNLFRLSVNNLYVVYGSSIKDILIGD